MKTRNFIFGKTQKIIRKMKNYNNMHSYHVYMVSYFIFKMQKFYFPKRQTDGRTFKYIFEKNFYETRLKSFVECEISNFKDCFGKKN